MNIDLLKAKYKKLVPLDIPKFHMELSYVRDKLGSVSINKMPMLIYSKNKRNALYYYLCIKHSIAEDRLLDYAITTGQTYIDQHFMNDDKDKTLYESLRYSDIAFISLSSFDYTNQYLESLLIELIEFRKNYDKVTIITFDIIDAFSYERMTAKLHNYFSSSSYPIINLVDVKKEGKEAFANEHSEASKSPQPKKKGRIK